jgi:hypothetical protein
MFVCVEDAVGENSAGRGAWPPCCCHIHAHKWDACLPFLGMCTHPFSQNTFHVLCCYSTPAVKYWRKRNRRLSNDIPLVGTADTDVYHQVTVLYDLATTFPSSLRRGNNELTDDIWCNYYEHVREEKRALTWKGGFFGPMLIWTFFIFVVCRNHPQTLAKPFRYILCVYIYTHTHTVIMLFVEALKINIHG